jgi:hypothetical protein
MHNHLTGFFVCNGRVLSSASSTISKNKHTTGIYEEPGGFCFRLDTEILILLSSIIMLQQSLDDTMKSDHPEYIRHKYYNCLKAK